MDAKKMEGGGNRWYTCLQPKGKMEIPDNGNPSLYGRASSSEAEDAMKVRFSVLIPAYNREKYVRQTIDSVLSQTFTDYEVIVIDDGSKDQTLQVLESYGTRIKVIRQPNRGAEAARNNAAALACGEYLAMLDSDDLLLPCALATYDRIIRTFDSPPLILAFIKPFRDGQSIPTNPQGSSQVEVLSFPDYISKDVRIDDRSDSQFVIRKSIFDEMGGYGHNGVYSFWAYDVDFLLKAGTYGPCVIVRKPLTVAYRENETSMSLNVKRGAEGLLGLVRFENQGLYPGGRERRWARYAVLGGIAANWALRHCWQRGERKVALRLLLGTAPMVFVALWKKFLRYLRKPTQPIVLP
jgi:glycosyltransferase involved in cell wall biosynthesis